MNRLILIFLAMFFVVYFTESKEIYQLSDTAKPHYLISVTRGGVPLGDIQLEMFPEVAPKHCRNFDSLVSIKFYDSLAFHRVIPNFMIQGGDPNSKNKPKSTWGYGDPSQTTVPAEFGTVSHQRGILSAARKGDDINSATSQFFICVAKATHLDGQYSVYGQVIKGMEVADAIVNSPRDTKDNPLEKIEMLIRSFVLSVDELKQSEIISIFPNPVVDEIRFKSSSDVLVSRISIFDNQGKTYFEQNYGSSVSVSEIKIPVNAIPSGVYFIKLTDNTNHEHILKIIVN